MVSSFLVSFFYRIRLRGSNKVGACAFNVQGWFRKECKERLHFMRCRVGWGWGWGWWWWWWWWFFFFFLLLLLLLLLLSVIVMNYQYNYEHHDRHPIFLVLRIKPPSQGLAPSLSIVAQEEKKRLGAQSFLVSWAIEHATVGSYRNLGSGVSLDSLCSKQFIMLILTVLWLWFMEKFSFIIVWIYPSRIDSSSYPFGVGSPVCPLKLG